MNSRSVRVLSIPAILIAVAVAVAGCAVGSGPPSSAGSPDGVRLHLAADETVPSGIYRPSRGSTARLELRILEELPPGFETVVIREGARSEIAAERSPGDVGGSKLGYGELQELRFTGGLEGSAVAASETATLRILQRLAGTGCEVLGCRGDGESPQGTICEVRCPPPLAPGG